MDWMKFFFFCLCTSYVFGLSGWSREVPFEVEGANEDFEDYILRLRLDTSRMIDSGILSEDASDLRFVTKPQEEATESDILLHKIANGTLNTPESIVYIQVPLITGNTATTLYMLSGNPNATAIVDPGNVFIDIEVPADGSIFLDENTNVLSFFAAENSTVYVEAGNNVAKLRAFSIVINGVVEGAGMGAVGEFQGGNGAGVGQWSNSAGAGGGAYGGVGGRGGYDDQENPNDGGVPYGSDRNLFLDIGSSGSGSRLARGGSAGAAFDVRANSLIVGSTAQFNLQGADGVPSSQCSGGGSGGGVLLYGDSLVNQGTYDLSGGNGGLAQDNSQDGGGGGGGGRAKFFYRDSIQDSSSVTAPGGKGSCCGDIAYGTDGSFGTAFTGPTPGKALPTVRSSCIPLFSCLEFDGQCGDFDNGCGFIFCGSCGDNQECVNRQCVDKKSSESNAGLIAGATIGGFFGLLLLLALIGLVVFFAMKAANRVKEDKQEEIPTQVEMNALPKSPSQVPLSAPIESTVYQGIPSVRNSVNLTRSVDLDLSRASRRSMNLSSGSYGSRMSSSNFQSSSWEIKYNEIGFIRELGRGAYGIVYLGSWRMQEVAVKKIKEENFTEKQYIDFKDEANLYMNLRPHRNVVGFLGVCIEPLCIVTEYLPNGTVENYLKTDAKLTYDLVFEWAKQIAAGMDHLHKEGLVHRDLASRNLLLDSNLNIKITDFGMSRVLSAGPENTTASDVGPLKWMAPESITNKEYSTKSDIWMYGMTLVEIITRQEPYPGLSPMEVAISVVRDGYLHPIPEHTPEDLRMLLLDCWQREPQHRPAFPQIYDRLAKMT